ncbi:MAG: hypothetical protein IPN76_33360 [Saprospiraceae bacterium]|nr:hypothetical protein [Saprospiraceae bacterium]
MGVRKTESRIPANHTAADLGQSAASADGNSTLVSFIANPIVVGRDNTYVLFVTNAGVAGSVQGFQWSFVENGGAPIVQTTQFGEAVYRPNATGTLTVTAKAMGAGNAELSSAMLSQDVVATNAELEGMITGATDQPGPGIGNPEVARELVNDHNIYYQSVALQAPEAGDGFKKMVFNMVYEGANHRSMSDRRDHLQQLAASLNGTGGDFGALAGQGAGVSGIRLAVLAMSLGGSPPLPWTELPESLSDRAHADEALRQSLAALDENQRIDLFNLARFPKSNITWCGKILEGLRNRYFPGANFNDVLTGMQGTRAHWIVRHFKEGPIAHS